MNHREEMIDNFTNLALMLSFQEVDNKLFDAFDRDDHRGVAYCGELYGALIDDVVSFIPAAKA